MAAVAAADVRAPVGAFEGRVVSVTSGEGVAGAELTFERLGAAFLARADSQGAFEFVPSAEGVYRLAAVTSPGFLPFAPEWEHSPIALTALRGQRIRELTFFLTPLVRYQGLVVDPSGAPVPRAQVRLLDSADTELALAPIAEAFESDAKGEFAFQAPDDALLEARHPDFSPGRARLDFAAQVSHRLTLKLEPKDAEPKAPLSLGGHVRDAQGGSFAGARVQVLFNGTGEHPEPAAVSGPDGEFELRGLDPGRYRVVAWADGLAPATAMDVPAGTTDLVLELLAASRVRGTVRAKSGGAPVAAFTVVLFQRRGPIARDRFAQVSVADPSGTYVIAGVPAGAYAVVAAANGFSPSSEVAVDVPEAPAADVVADLQLASGGAVKGLVRDEASKQALAGAVVSTEGSVAGASALPLLASARTDATGAFELRGLAQGQRSITVAAADHNGRIVGGLDVRDGVTLGPLTIELSKVKEGEAPQLELVGVGAVLFAKGDAMVIEQVLPGGGAAEAGLIAGDAIVEIEGVPAAELGFAGSIEKIRGPEGTSVLLQVRRPGEGAVESLHVNRRRIRR